MATNHALGAKSADKSQWKDAFKAVTRLAAAREATMNDMERDRRGATSDRRARATGPGVDPNQLARAVAEIEKASAALRRSEPGAGGRTACAGAQRNAKAISFRLDSHRRHLDLGDAGGRRRRRRYPLRPRLTQVTAHVAI
jgi:hypothetical protein